jgi:hypothetical protein
MLDASLTKASAKIASRKFRARPKAEAGTRVGNGKDILPGVINGQSFLARRIRELLFGFVSDMGGDPSEAKYAIAKRASILVAWCEETEGRLANGGEFDPAVYVLVVNALRRLLCDIGLERHARDITQARETIRDRIIREKAA